MFYIGEHLSYNFHTFLQWTQSQIIWHTSIPSSRKMMNTIGVYRNLNFKSLPTFGLNQSAGKRQNNF